MPTKFDQEYPPLSFWEKWRVRWAALRWRALLPWVKIPSSLDTPKTVTFPLFEKMPPEIRLTDIAKRD